MQSPVTVYGAGSWGTALALLLAEKGIPTLLWARNPAQRAEMIARRENTKYLPGFPFPGFIHVVPEDAPPAPAGSTAVLAVPSHGLRPLLEDIPGAASPLWVIATKGLEEESCLRMSEVLDGVRGTDANGRVTLAGPSLAKEVAQKLPAAVLAASESEEAAKTVQGLFAGDRFRVYRSSDPVGVELATSLKNVVAVAAGIADGLELGKNAQGALLTRGLAEITRLGVRLGARVETFLGLAGVGDLVTTCTSELSRNHSLGVAMGRGASLDEALAGMSMVAEGVNTTTAARSLAQKYEVEAPITEQLYRILFEGREAAVAINELMTRPLRAE